ncbi:MAG: sugar ABC transporter permease [Niameybacter sp.]|uniref:carbohydrate ABC transporter permease n=1 Tax=Niameybacter sp. TaxID=2033640 RepID=UPI002FC851D6
MNFVQQQKKKFLGVLKQVRLNYDAYLLLAPFGIIFILFTLLPVVVALYYSFTYYNVLEPAQFIGFQNYINLFVNDDVFLIALKNTFIIAAITGLIGYFACFFFAWLINELPPIPRSIMVLVFYAPSISGSAFLIWSIIFSGDAYGYLNAILLNLGLVNAPVRWLTDPKYMLGVVIIVQLWMSLGAGFLSFVAGFKMVDQSQYEAGYIDGIKNRWQELWFITFPSMRPQLMFGAVMTITSSFTVADVTAQLCGSPSTDYAAHTILNHLNDYGGVRFDMGYACAIATILFITMLTLNQIIQKLLHKLGR